MQPLLAQISLDFNSQDGFVICSVFAVGFVCLLVLWLFELIALLKRQDLKDVDKITWTIVLCVLNVLGLLLYWFLAPVDPRTAGTHPGPRSEKELKDYFNRRG
jgi:hypothetical protein